MEHIKEDVKIAVIGNVDSGKSSLIGTLLRGENDDGRGKNREIVMNYRHELTTGQTSSVGFQIIGFRKDGSLINIKSKSKLKKDIWPKIIKETEKLITFMDLAGHEKYLKTTIHGISSNHPDYAIILVEAKGMRGMTKEHIMLALSFNIPFIIIITKIDLYPNEMLLDTIKKISKLLKNVYKEVWVIKEDVDMEIPLQGLNKRFVPIFTISNVTGDGMDLLKKYLYRLPKRIDYMPTKNQPFEIAVLESFMVQGIGLVAHGFITSGIAKVGDTVWIGPDSMGKYHKSKLKTMQYKTLNVNFVLPGNHCTISLPNIDRTVLKHGMYILHENVSNRISCSYFTADLKVLTNNPITIKEGYCPILNIDNIRMSAQVLKITTIPDDNNIGKEQEFIRGGQKARVEFKFIYRPAYIKKDSTFVFREGLTRGYGKVIKID